MKKQVSASAAIALETSAMFFVCILAPISFVLMAVGMATSSARGEGTPGSGWTQGAAVVVLSAWIVGAVTMIVAKVFSSILLYRLWASIPEEHRSISPGRAVGFCFIPFYCFYWFFVAYPGLVTEASKYAGTRGPFGLAVAYAVLLCATPLFAWHILLYPFILFPQYIVWLLMIIGMSRQANACLMVPSRA